VTHLTRHLGELAAYDLVIDEAFAKRLALHGILKRFLVTQSS
jgi:hypothetical protein